MSAAPALDWTELDDKAVDTARVLAMDAVQKVGNGHPGTAMSLAPAAYLLFQKVMRHDPADPQWIARDRFVLSCGHSSITLYTQLYLGGFGLELEDLKALRTWGSKTPGHPELHHTPGVEVTTGPLGQGVANAVGMAMSGRRVHGLLDPDAAPGESLFDHHVYVMCSDGDLQEGVSGEASSIAGTQELGNLTVIYDRNRISIEGDTDIAFTEDVAKRYEAYGWHVQVVDWTNGGTEYVEDVPALYDAVTAAARGHRQAVADRARHDHRVAGAQRPGHREGARQRARRRGGRGHQEGPRLGPRRAPSRCRPRSSRTPGRCASAAPTGVPSGTSSTTPGRRPTPTRRRCCTGSRRARCPRASPRRCRPSRPSEKGVATRSASGDVINAIAPLMPELWGGSADLAGSNNTTIKSAPVVPAARRGHRGVEGRPLPGPGPPLRHP